MKKTDILDLKKLKVDLRNRDEIARASALMRQALGFSAMDCRKALYACGGNVNDAAEYLASGEWMRGKLISWDFPALKKDCAILVSQTDLAETLCWKTLQNCGGNVDLANRKLQGLSALPDPDLKTLKVDLDSPTELSSVALLLHQALGFDIQYCESALFASAGCVNDAAEHLASGKWMSGLLIRWDIPALTASSEKLVALTGLPSHLCFDMLKNCGGNVELALRKIMFKPALP